MNVMCTSIIKLCTVSCSTRTATQSKLANFYSSWINFPHYGSRNTIIVKRVRCTVQSVTRKPRTSCVIAHSIHVCLYLVNGNMTMILFMVFFRNNRFEFF